MLISTRLKSVSKISTWRDEDQLELDVLNGRVIGNTFRAVPAGSRAVVRENEDFVFLTGEGEHWWWVSDGIAHARGHFLRADSPSQPHDAQQAPELHTCGHEVWRGARAAGTVRDWVRRTRQDDGARATA